MSWANADDFCFVHSADLHLGGRRWLSSVPCDPDMAERVRLADRAALRKLIELCLTERAALLLCAGDIVDGWCRDHGVGLWLVEQVLHLKEAGCQVVWVLGNHDLRSRVVRPLLLPGHAQALGLMGPETRVIEQLQVALHGWSCPDPEGPTDVAALYPPPLPGLFNIGLLHTSAEGIRGHISYAPCSRLTLRHHGYDYWALGHVHHRAVLSEQPWVVFPGNLQGRGPREAGAKGATLVRVAKGKVKTVTHRPLCSVCFTKLVVDAEDARRFDDVLELAHAALSHEKRKHPGRPAVVRLVIEGLSAAACSFQVPALERSRALRALAAELSDSSLWLDETWVDAGEVGSWRLDAA